MALTDSSGSIAGEYSDELFGSTTQTGTSGNASQFTGRENDATGLYYYRARYYSPQLQRFISEDGLDFLAGDTNLYAYVGNDPCNNTDPSGNLLVAGCVGGAIFDAGLYSALALSGKKFVEKPFNWRDFGKAALIGCASGAAGVGLVRAGGHILRGLRGLRHADDVAGRRTI